MLPKRTAKRSALNPRARLISTTATAKPPGEEHGEGGVALERPARRRRSMPTAASTVTTKAPEEGREAEEEAEGHPGQRHVGQRVGDEREAARDEEHPDGRADEGGHDAGHERPLHEAVLEELREHGPPVLMVDQAHGRAVERASASWVRTPPGRPQKTRWRLRHATRLTSWATTPMSWLTMTSVTPRSRLKDRRSV